MLNVAFEVRAGGGSREGEIDRYSSRKDEGEIVSEWEREIQLKGREGEGEK